MIQKVVLAALFVVGMAAPVFAAPKIHQFPGDGLQLNNEQYINSKIIFPTENNQIRSHTIAKPELSELTISYYSANCPNFYWILFAIQNRDLNNNEVNFNQFERYIMTPINGEYEAVFEVCW
ncbi:MAG: hypothetical protein SWJ54_11540 [Cyanobacteriota bacterium]|nr:hypothetical protein [Cyanobacteriota bacterium]